MGIDRSLIAKFERGERSIGVAPLERACRLFGCLNCPEYTLIQMAFTTDISGMSIIETDSKIIAVNTAMSLEGRGSRQLMSCTTLKWRGFALVLFARAVSK